MFFQSNWSENDIYILTVEWEKGTTSSIIGKLLGRTRNSIIGKAHRLGINTPNTPSVKLYDIKRARTGKPQVRNFKKEREEARKKGLAYAMTPVSTKKKPPKFYAAAMPLPGANPVGIMELGKNTCRAIVGKDNTIHKLATYCGNEVFPGQSYCPTHCAMYFKSPESRRRAA